jgi:hypothetical protein
MWADAGRDPDALDITMMQPPVDRDEIRKVLDRADELGIRRILVQIWTEDMPNIEAILDGVATTPSDR